MENECGVGLGASVGLPGAVRMPVSVVLTEGRAIALAKDAVAETVAGDAVIKPTASWRNPMKTDRMASETRMLTVLCKCR